MGLLRTIVSYSHYECIQGEIFISRLGIVLNIGIENNPAFFLLESFENLWFHVGFSILSLCCKLYVVRSSESEPELVPPWLAVLGSYNYSNS